MMITPEQEKYNIGRNIRKFRMENRLTQKETVAELHARGIDMSRGTYSHIECGLDNIWVEELLTLAEIFHVDIADFFKGLSLR